jgi:DNA-binding MarR family transcriptional regulator
MNKCAQTNPELEQSPSYQLWRATNAWQRTARKALEPFGITHAQFLLLASVNILSGDSDRVCQADVARFADFDENMTSQLVKSLAERSYITRSRNPTDARARTVSITPEGRKVLHEAKAAVKPLVAEFFAPLSDVQAFVAELQAIVKAAED